MRCVNASTEVNDRLISWVLYGRVAACYARERLPEGQSPRGGNGRAMGRDPYERIGRRELYRNPWVIVEAHEIVHPTGTRGEHVLVVTPQSCGIVVEDGEDLLFTRQPRFAAAAYATEIVKGGQNSGEPPLDAAKRELREELGVTAARWSELGRLYEIPSIVAPPVVLFLAQDVTLGPAQPEDQESIGLVRLPRDTAIDAALSGEIDDAVTIAALFRYAVASGTIARRAVP